MGFYFCDRCQQAPDENDLCACDRSAPAECSPPEHEDPLQEYCRAACMMHGASPEPDNTRCEVAAHCKIGPASCHECAMQYDGHYRRVYAAEKTKGGTSAALPPDIPSAFASEPSPERVASPVQGEPTNETKGGQDSTPSSRQ